MIFKYELDRSALGPVEDGVTDKKLILDWLKMTFSMQAAAADPFYKLLWYRVFRKIEASDIFVEITDDEVVMISIALLRLNVGPEATEIMVQILNKLRDFL